VNRPELSPFPMSTNFNSSAFTSLPSNKGHFFFTYALLAVVYVLHVMRIDFF
jgi:hypothetical protein